MGRRRGGTQRATRVRHCATRSPCAVLTRLLSAARQRLSTCAPPVVLIPHHSRLSPRAPILHGSSPRRYTARDTRPALCHAIAARCGHSALVRSRQRLLTCARHVACIFPRRIFTALSTPHSPRLLGVPAVWRGGHGEAVNSERLAPARKTARRTASRGAFGAFAVRCSFKPLGRGSCVV